LSGNNGLSLETGINTGFLNCLVAKISYLIKCPVLSWVIMPFKYTDEKENFLYAWRAFSYGKKIEIFC